MVQIFSFAMFTAVLLISIAAIVATVKAEMPFILRALGIEPHSNVPLLPEGGRRIRVIRQARLGAPTPGLRVAA